MTKSYKNTLFLLTVLSGSLLLLGQTTNLPILTLKTEATVWSDRIYLQDLANLSETTPVEVAQLIMGASPQPGRTEQFSRQEIQKKLLANRVTFDRIFGAETVNVRRVGEELSPQLFVPKIKEYISARIAPGEQLSVEMLSSQPIIAPKNANWRIYPAKGQDFIGNILFALEGLDSASGRPILQHWLNVKVYREAQVAISNRSIGSGENIASTDVRFEWRPLTASILQAFTRPDQLQGRKADRILPANQVITPAYVRQEFMVQRGVIATLTARSGGVRASAPVKVLENGTMDEWVMVQNPLSAKTFKAKVSGKNLLEVVL